MMTLGIDTSNYTTSVALYDADSGEIRQQKRLLPVREGELGLRQNDAVLAHIKALPILLEELLTPPAALAAVGVSTKPRDVEGSYMPCFLAGESAARAIGAAMGIPVCAFSHQAGHIAAALYGAGRLDLFDQPFVAFHISGGTTECLAVEPSGGGFCVETIARSLDLHAGQAVDRVGAMLGLAFPAGSALEKLALTSAQAYHPKVTFKGADCCLSGLENQCRDRLQRGEASPDVARFCLDYLAQVLLTMAEHATARFPARPLVFAGGVMANTIIRQAVEERFAASFAPPVFSGDNAVGVAVLSSQFTVHSSQFIVHS
jgi:N6-L-threonylcarbamoyladenine synthase